QSYLRHCVDVAVQVASPVVAGPMYSPVGRTWRLDDAERKEVIARVAQGLRPVADYAAQAGVGLAIEPLNRFETSLINTVEQALELVAAVDSPACGIALDTFHMNIEERDLGNAIRAAGSHLAHVQVCANDRGAPGADHLDWPAIASALADVGYRGALCIESFTAENQTIATAASIWRPLARSQDAIATDGLAFLRQVLAG
ncbi:MAG TPA: sugar phosphate isomerase/epimerase family protein, partial [Gemmatimonadaceae bacterium]|nr:sugar phosphate isomerase/epimerase family protein [Gemmatimonadaceae bacterium]